MKTISFFLLLLLFYSPSFGNEAKQLQPTGQLKVRLNLTQFVNYLENGRPDKLEGIYTSADNRYLIALIKNDESSHDFIGVVIAADNPFWAKGCVKFNFVKTSNHALNGYYYTQKRSFTPFTFHLENGNIKSSLLKMVNTNHLKNSILAYAN